MGLHNGVRSARKANAGPLTSTCGADYPFGFRASGGEHDLAVQPSAGHPLVSVPEVLKRQGLGDTYG